MCVIDSLHNLSLVCTDAKFYFLTASISYIDKAVKLGRYKILFWSAPLRYYFPLQSISVY
jgi:hypothetical protein